MKRLIMSKERQPLQIYRDHKDLQIRFARQENLLHTLQQENKALLFRIRQYEHCLDDVMRKIVDALVAEDSLREDVAILKSRVQDLEVQNANLCNSSPFKGRDEGYCTMSNEQVQPSNGHTSNLPEEPQQWLLPSKSCPIEVEDWSMSQEELPVIILDEKPNSQFKRQQQQHHQQQHQREQSYQQQPGTQVGVEKFFTDYNEPAWNSNDWLNSTMAEIDSVADNISQVLQQTIIYSDDEEVASSEFTNDFYKLVNIRSNSVCSLCSYTADDSDSEGDNQNDDDDNDVDNDVDNDDNNLTSNQKSLGGKMLKVRLKVTSPTPSEAGRAQVTSCSSSETYDISQYTTTSNAGTLTQQQHEEEEDLIFNLTYSKGLNSLRSTLPSENCQNLKKQSFNIEIENIEYENDDSDNNHPFDIVVRQHHKEKEINYSPALLSSSSSSSIMENSPSKAQRQLNEKEYIEQVIRFELNRIPRHKLMKSQSNIENTIQKIQRHRKLNVNNQVVRCGSMNEKSQMNHNNRVQEQSMNWNVEEETATTTNLWRRSNGWKRLDSPLRPPTTCLISTDRNENQCKTLTEVLKNPSQVPPTRIPLSRKMNANKVKFTTPALSSNYLHTIPLQNQLKSDLAFASISTSATSTKTTASAATMAASVVITPSTRKSKIPPPVFVRCSYAS